MFRYLLIRRNLLKKFAHFSKTILTVILKVNRIDRKGGGNFLSIFFKMAEKRKGKKRKEDFPSNEEQPEKPAKEEYAIAKWLKKNVPHKKTKFLYHNVEYFTGAKAIDALLESHFTIPKKEGDETFFKTRADVVEFLDVMLRHKFFHRAKKVPVSEEELLARKKKKKEKDTDKKDDKRDADDAESSHAEGKCDDKSEPKGIKEKKKRKIRLEMHFEQIFADGLDAYVWIYDPIPFHYWVFGTLLVLGAIGICLFPLWPPDVRKGVYYISIAAAGFLCLIVALTIFRLIVFCIIWCLTFGKHHLWLLPNLTDDVGFFASFWPLYQYEYKGKETEKSSRKKKKKKEKDSDNEEEDDEDRQDDGHIEAVNRYIRAQDLNDKKDFDNDDTEPKTSEGERNSPSESESEHSSQKSQTGRDFEMVEKEEVENSS